MVKFQLRVKNIAQKKKVQKAGPIITKGRKIKLRRNTFNAIMRGHFAAEFKSKKVARDRADEEQFSYNEDESDADGVLLMATIKGEDDDQWYLDTGFSNHMSGKKNWFYINLNESVKRKIRFAYNIMVNAKGIRNVMIRRNDGTESFISDMLYVPTMRSNLISLGQLLEKGYTMKMEACAMKVYNSKGRLILKAPL